jgi:hypothetical protein
MADGGQDKTAPRTLMQAFEEAPLPQGTEILAEIHLLAWSLVGSVAGNADRRLAMSNVADSGDGFIHAVHVQNGAVVGEGWHERRPDGSGRRYHDVPSTTGRSIGGGCGRWTRVPQRRPGSPRRSPPCAPQRTRTT